MIGVSKTKSDWTIWSDLRKYCKTQGTDVSLMIESLDFSSLEG